MRRFALDLRSLAAGRVALAGLLLIDLAQRAQDLTAHYTDLGVLPRGDYQLLAWDFSWSLHRLGGSAAFEAALFAVAALCAGALLVGYRTFWASAACWLLTVSLHARNPLLRDGQDDLFRVLLFWGLFLPFGAVASLDARAGRKPPAFQEAGGSALHLGYVVQLVLIYAVSAAGKYVSPWWTSGDGIWHALRMGRYETPFGQWLSHRTGLTVLSFGVIALETFGMAVWLGVRNWKVRTGVVAAFVALHLGFLFTMRLGLFPWVCFAAWVPMLPGEVWERAARWRLGERPTPLPTPLRAPVRSIPTAVLAVGLFVSVWSPLVFLLPQYAIPKWPLRLAEGVGLQQYWVLFAPRGSSPFVQSDGWLLIPAVLADGTQVDLQTGASPPNWERPEIISTTFHNARWRHYFANMANLLWPFPPRTIQMETLEKSRAAYARYLCREWNTSHSPEKQVRYLTLFLMRFRTDRPEVPAQRELLVQTPCL